MRRLFAFIAAVIMFAAVPHQADAQLLKKLDKALNKVEKAVKRVSEVTKPVGDEPAKEDEKAEKTVKADHNSTTVSAEPVRTVNVEEVGVVPRITPATRYIQAEIYGFDSFSDVSEGLFTLNTNPQLAVYSVDGSQVFAANYRNAGYDNPGRFDGGVAVMYYKEPNSYKTTLAILYRNGTKKLLPTAWDKVSQFRDGVALVRDKESVFFIDTKGNAVYPNLVFKTDEYIEPEEYIRPLADGRRAYYDFTVQKWGFVDEKGNVVVQPVYGAVRDYHDGYALVPAEDTEGYHHPAFIDVTGKEVYRLKERCTNEHINNQYSMISNVYGDVFMSCFGGGRPHYYDIKGNEVGSPFNGTTFYGDYAFTMEGGQSRPPLYVVDKRMNKVKCIQGLKLTGIGHKYVDDTNPYLLVFDDRYVISRDGDLKIKIKEGERGRIGGFSKDGYARAVATVDGKEVQGIINMKGEFVIVFDKSKPSTVKPGEKAKPLPEQTLETSPKPSLEPTPSPEPAPKSYAVAVSANPAEAVSVITGTGNYASGTEVTIGAKVKEGWAVKEVELSGGLMPGNHKMSFVVNGDGQAVLNLIAIKWPDKKKDEEDRTDKKADEYTITVVAEPAEGGTVVGGGTYKKGDILTISGKENEGWMLTSVQSKGGVSKKGSPLRYSVYGDATITVKFAKEEEEKNGSGAYQTMWTLVSKDEEYGPAPLYLEMSETGSYQSPYGDKTGGVFVWMIDPHKKLETKKESKKGTIQANIFFVPMRVTGITEADGRKWIMMAGGQMHAANIRAIEDEKTQGAGMMNLMMAFSGVQEISSSPRQYRLEIKSFAPDKSSVTLGELQEFSAKHGWIPGGDKRGKVTHRKGMATYNEYGLDAPIFNGAVLKKCAPRKDILWTPPADFYENKTAYESAAKKMGEMYRSFTSDYENFVNGNIPGVKIAEDGTFGPKE